LLPLPSTTLWSTLLARDSLRAADIVIVFTRQDGVDWDLLERDARLVFDCCRALRTKSAKVVRL
jgi:hypothetical protein